MRWPRPLAVLLLVGAACTGACTDPRDADPRDASGGAAAFVAPADAPNVLIVVIDCLRADHVGAYGYPRPTTPVLDELAASGARFERAIAQSNWTRPSVASLLTGLHVAQHRVPGSDEASDQVVADLGNRVLHGNRLSASFTTLAEVLQAGGYGTGAFINQAQMPPEMQFDQGFDTYDAEKKGDRATVDRFVEWSAEQDRFFGYVHLLGLHFPYLPRPRNDVFRTTFDLLPTAERNTAVQRALGQRELGPADIPELIDLYDGTLIGMDAQLGRLVAALRQRDQLDNTLLIVTSDHGEAFGEHGTMFHGGDALYEEVLRVPLIAHWPAGIAAGTLVPGTVELVDVMPTVLTLAGAPIPENLAGISMASALSGEAPGAPPEDAALAEATSNPNLKALYLGSRKYLFDLDSGSVAIYALDADPGETADLSATVPAAEIEQARARLDTLLAAHARFAAEHPVTMTDINPEDAQRLRSLGYIQ